MQHGKAVSGIFWVCAVVPFFLASLCPFPPQPASQSIGAVGGMDQQQYTIMGMVYVCIYVHQHVFFSLCTVYRSFSTSFPVHSCDMQRGISWACAVVPFFLASLCPLPPPPASQSIGGAAGGQDPQRCSGRLPHGKYICLYMCMVEGFFLCCDVT